MSILAIALISFLAGFILTYAMFAYLPENKRSMLGEWRRRRRT